MFAEAGLPHLPELDKVPRSRHALMLGELARDRGVLDDLHPRLFEAYWARGRDLGDTEVLVEEAAAAGLEHDAVLAALENDEYATRVSQQTDAALDLGVGGVPAWIIDERYLVPGAQPHDVFDQVLQRLGHSPLSDEHG